MMTKTFDPKPTEFWAKISRPEFVPPGWLRNGHLQTIGTIWPRRFHHLPPPEQRLIAVSEDTKLRLDCNWQPERNAQPTILMVHGLEGSSESQYMVGMADKAWAAGFNAVRVNIRNCGGTDHLTPKLYNAGLSDDLASVIEQLIADEGLPELHLAGYSMGGNTLLKLAGEWNTETPPQVKSLGTVSPSIDLARCADALHQRSNILYERRFVRGLKTRYRLKARLFPDIYQTNGIEKVVSVREFDDVFTAPHAGYGNAANYYHRASALRVIDEIALPTMILAAQDDPFIPVVSFSDPAVTNNSNIMLLTPEYGGHAGFIQARSDGEDSFWAENRIVEFARLHTRLA
jgi:predicted alpha/beta-fold hydrolase